MQLRLDMLSLLFYFLGSRSRIRTGIYEKAKKGVRIASKTFRAKPTDWDWVYVSGQVLCQKQSHCLRLEY